MADFPFFLCVWVLGLSNFLPLDYALAWIESLEAALMICDLRGFTEMSNRLPSARVLEDSPASDSNRAKLAGSLLLGSGSTRTSAPVIEHRRILGDAFMVSILVELVFNWQEECPRMTTPLSSRLRALDTLHVSVVLQDVQTCIRVCKE